MRTVGARFAEPHDEAVREQAQSDADRTAFEAAVDEKFAALWAVMRDLNEEVRSRDLGEIDLTHKAFRDEGHERLYELRRKSRGSFPIEFLFPTGRPDEAIIAFGTGLRRPKVSVSANERDELRAVTDGLSKYIFEYFKKAAQHHKH